MIHWMDNFNLPGHSQEGMFEIITIEQQPPILGSKIEIGLLTLV